MDVSVVIKSQKRGGRCVFRRVEPSWGLIGMPRWLVAKRVSVSNDDDGGDDAHNASLGEEEVMVVGDAQDVDR